MLRRGPGSGRALCLLVAVVALGACTTSTPDEPDGRPRRDIAATPQSLPPLPASEMATATATARPGARPPATGRPGGSPVSPAASATASGPATTGRPPASATTGPGGSAAPYRPVATVTDARGDAGGATPAYADLVAVTIEDDGTNARVTVRFAGTVPARVPADEVLGVGVDVYRSPAQVESDYQLFADGQPDGWYAYLQTPDGFVKYPGTFGIGGDRLVFTVPWSALGAPRDGAFSAFADWTRDAAPANLAGEDHAPDLATTRFSR